MKAFIGLLMWSMGCFGIVMKYILMLFVTPESVSNGCFGDVTVEIGNTLPHSFQKESMRYLFASIVPKCARKTLICDMFVLNICQVR